MLAKQGMEGYDIGTHKEEVTVMFEGFSPETVDFLWGIRMNNCRDWFLANKQSYVTYLYEPMKALGKELFQPFIDKSGTLLKVSRIYRDLPSAPDLRLCTADADGEARQAVLRSRTQDVARAYHLTKPQ